MVMVFCLITDEPAEESASARRRRERGKPIVFNNYYKINHQTVE